jgi:hypothetical protein
MTFELIAIRSFSYAGRPVKAGERFFAESQRDATLLLRFGAAREVSYAEPAAGKFTHVRLGRRRQRYEHRMMTARGS